MILPYVACGLISIVYKFGTVPVHKHCFTIRRLLSIGKVTIHSHLTILRGRLVALLFDVLLYTNRYGFLNGSRPSFLRDIECSWSTGKIPYPVLGARQMRYIGTM